MGATFTIPLITVIPGQLISASLWNNEFENIDTNFIPAGMDDYSANDSEMQTATDPYPGSVTSRPTSLQGELERIRYTIRGNAGGTYWYQPPTVDLTTMKTRFDAHTHSGAANHGPQITVTGLADNAVTTAKINALAVTDAKINDVATTKLTGTIATAQIANLGVTNAKINDVDWSKITTTTRPAFLGYVAAGTTSLGSSYTAINFTEIYDQGSNYSDPTFTAPVTGIYHCSCSLQIGSFSSQPWIYLYLATTSNPLLYEIIRQSGTTNNENFQISVPVKMTAGETVAIKTIVVGGATLFGGTVNNGGGSPVVPQSWFAVALL